jgi:Protein of unknown function (DUF1656)
MIGDVDLHGVLVAPLLVWILIAYVLSVPIRKLLDRSGFYRLVWHRSLFDVALLVILTGAVSDGINDWLAR